MNNNFLRIIEQMKKDDINQLLVCDPYSINYLTNQMFDTGERMLMLLINQDQTLKLYIHEMFATNIDSDIKIVNFKDTDNYLKMLHSDLDNTKQVAVDKKMVAHHLIGLQELGFNKSVILGSYIIDEIRGLKTKEEIEFMRESSHINDKVMLEIQLFIKENRTNLTEAKVEEQLRVLFAKYTDEGYSFDPIVGFGKNAADPHHEIDNTKLENGNCIVLDIGCIKNGYCSDMTRTIFLDSASDFHQEIYNIVKEANLYATSLVKPGVKASDIDKAARDYITDKGYGQYFTHRLGHFIGTEVHEAGDISANNNQELKVGNIFSIEPGIYIYDKEIGVRLENLIVVTENGYESLNELSLDLVIV